MDTRAADLIALLRLTPHPEGGYFREIHRSAAHVQPGDGRTTRVALTTIYFLLTAGDVSRWHRVGSDEVWHYYEGDPLDLFTADTEFSHITHRVLGRLGAEVQPVVVVAAGEWQAARSSGLYTLVGCTVAPGFEFTDFEMLRDCPAEAAAFRQRHAAKAAFV